MQAVKDSGADLGIAHDGDADRMMAVDEQGRFISGDKLLAILAQASKTKNIVTTIDASMSIEEMGYKTKRTKVGDPFVSEELKKGGKFGGEPSGAWVFPDFITVRTGFMLLPKSPILPAAENYPNWWTAFLLIRSFGETSQVL